MSQPPSPTLYGGADPRLLPAYSLSEAARYVHVPVETVRDWIGRPQGATPCIRPDGENSTLSFFNLVEAYVLAHLTEYLAIPAPKVRDALRYATEELGVARPLLPQPFETDGEDLFVHRSGQVLRASRGGEPHSHDVQRIRPIRLTRVDQDEAGLPVRFYPYTRKLPRLDDPRIVIVDPYVSFGRASVYGAPTSVIAERYYAGDSMTHLAEDYGIPPEAVEEAVRIESRLAHAA